MIQHDRIFCRNISRKFHITHQNIIQLITVLMDVKPHECQYRGLICNYHRPTHKLFQKADFQSHEPVIVEIFATEINGNVKVVTFEKMNKIINKVHLHVCVHSNNCGINELLEHYCSSNMFGQNKGRNTCIL